MSNDHVQQPTLPAELELGAVHLVVTDLDRSLGFYERSIGLRTHSRHDEVAAMGAGGEDLLVLHERPAARRAGRHAGLYHFALLHPSRRELARALARLRQEETPLQGLSDHGISEAIYLPDPDGNGIELAADRPREHWGDLRDPTTIGPAPLDVTGLMAEIAGEAGVPESADRDLRVGHLHLHVGDVGEGLAFYRDVVGFEVMTDFGSAAFVAAGGYHHHLGFNVWRGAGVPPVPADVVGLERWTVRIAPAALSELRSRFEQAGIAMEETRDGGVLVADPWRIPLEVRPL